jgi:hypothetical protein
MESKQDHKVVKLLELTGIKWQRVPRRRDRVRLCSGPDAKLYELDDDERINTHFGKREQIMKLIEPQTSVMSSKTGEFTPQECYFAEKQQDVYDALDEAGKKESEVLISQIVVTGTGIYSDNAINELLVNSVLQHLLTNSVTPHLLHVHQFYYHPKDGASMCMEKFDYDLDDFAGRKKTWWTLERMGVVIFQALHVLYVLQTVLQFKHHDLHDQNVALIRITDDMYFRGHHLLSASHFVYTVEGVTFYVPNIGYLVKITDMGFASVTVGGRRMQRVDLEHFNDKPSTYGYWDAEFEGKKGYDVQVLLSKFMTPTFHSLCKKNRDMKQFMEVLYFTALGPKGKNSQKQRPLVVNNEPVSLLLQQVFGPPHPSKKKNSGLSFVNPPPPPTPAAASAASAAGDSPAQEQEGKAEAQHESRMESSESRTYKTALADFTTPNLGEVTATYYQFFKLE